MNLKRWAFRLPWWLQPIAVKMPEKPAVLVCPKSNSAKHHFTGYKNPTCRWCGLSKDDYERGIPKAS